MAHDPVYFIDKDKWAEIYDKARENGYSVFHFIIETMRRSLRYPQYEPTDEQIVIKLERVEEDIIYRLVMNKDIWPDVT